MGAVLEAYLAQRFGSTVQLVALQPLGDDAISVVTASASVDRRLKTYGYGQPLLVRYRIAGEERSAVFQTVAANPFGHERRADRAANLLLSYDTFSVFTVGRADLCPVPARSQPTPGPPEGAAHEGRQSHAHQQ